MKKLALPIVTLIIGFVTGYLIFKNSTPKFPFQFGPGSFEKSHSLLPQAIDSAVAAKNIADYQKMVSASVPGTQGPFHGFFLDSASLQKVLSEKVDGISFYLGMDPYNSINHQNYVTIYYTGAKANLHAPPRFINSKDVYEYVYPCPTACGTLAP